MNRCSTPATSSGSPPRSLKASAATRPSAGVISSNGLAPAAAIPASRASHWGSSGMLTRSSHAADEQVSDPDATAGTVSILSAIPTTFAPSPVAEAYELTSGHQRRISGAPPVLCWSALAGVRRTGQQPLHGDTLQVSCRSDGLAGALPLHGRDQPSA